MIEQRSGITRVESKGSFWIIDNDLNRYCRFPKHEGPRERPEWGGPEAGALQDAVWHTFEGEWFIDPIDRLFIQVEWSFEQNDWRCVVAPWASIREESHA